MFGHSLGRRVGGALTHAAMLLVTMSHQLGGQADSVSRAMNRPVAPFRVIGNVYYVGASDVTSFLIATSSGLIVLDGGFAETAPQVLANIGALGFDPRAVRILLNSHAHYDHAGGLATLKERTGAALYAGRSDSALLAAGGRGDFFFGDRFPFPPVTVEHAVRDGDHIRLGDVMLTAIATPGHTRGCTTWWMQVRENGRDYAVLFVCSLSIPGYSLRDSPAYPTIARDYQDSIRKLRRVRCDVFLAAHGSMFALAAKAARARAGTSRSPFVDPSGCRAYLDHVAREVARHLVGP